MRSTFAFQRNIAFCSLFLFFAKWVAWYLTKSDAIFSDAMESIANIVAGFMGLYALHLASKPRDQDHPYGHGKVEFITSGVEAVVIIISGIIIMGQSVMSLILGHFVHQLDWGIWIVAFTAVANYILGAYSYQRGKKKNSMVLMSSGRHLQSDTISTGGIVLSLILVYFTQIFWLDSVVALLAGAYIIYSGYQILRPALSGIMDEADEKMLKNLANLLEKNRRPQWIDVHNTRIQQHGSGLHLDAHLTLPWYYTLRESHDQMTDLVKLISENTERDIEFNFHMDDCKSFSCKICTMPDCPVRQHALEKIIPWNSQAIAQPDKHHCSAE